MAWEDRIITPAYISPSGTRFEFQHENVSMSVDKKTGEFTFPEIDGSYIMDLGASGRKFPFVIFFSGDDYDIVSDAFFASLEEIGIGTLEHPVYKIRKVVPTGTIIRRDDLVTAANQAAFNVTFSETIEDLTFPVSDLNQENQIKISLDELNFNTSAQYSGSIVPGNESENAVLQQDLLNKKTGIEQLLENITQLNEDIDNAFQTISDSFDNNLINLLTDPEGVADQLITLINTPANVITNATTFIEGYGNSIRIIFDAVDDTPNKFFNSFLNIASLFGALNFAMTNTEFLYRPDAINAADSIVEINDSIIAWMDEKIVEFEISDTGETYDSMMKLYSETIAYLIRLSFDLPKEIFFTLQEDRNIIELVAELYDDIDKIDFFIETNNLISDEIEILPLGKEVVYYE
jgi:prophage DNA circulation protein